MSVDSAISKMRAGIQGSNQAQEQSGAQEQQQQTQNQEQNTESQAQQQEQQQQQQNENNDSQEQQNQSQEQQQEAKPEINDDLVLGYLRENRGIEADSIEDVFKPKEPVNQFANEEIAKINKFISDTGRDVQDYYSMNEDISEKSDTEILRAEYLRKGGSKEDFDVEYDLDLTPLSEDDGYSADEVSRRNRAIKKRDLRIKKEAQDGRSSINELKEKLSQPIEGFSKPGEKERQGAENWKNGVSEALKDFDLGIEGFKYESSPEELTERYSNIESLLNDFKGQDGNLNHKQLIKTLEIGKNIESILKVIKQQGVNSGTEDVIKKLENPGNTTPKEGGSQMSAEEARMRKKLLGQ